MIESLIAILILSAGLVLYSKNWTANFGAKSATHVRSIAATQVAEVGNALLAHVVNLDRTTPPGQIVSRVQQFSNQLTDEINQFAQASGYECRNNQPHPWPQATNQSMLANSTLARTWAQGASSCISITPLPNQATPTNGVWVRIQASWINPHTSDNQVETVSVHALVSPL